MLASGTSIACFLTKLCLWKEHMAISEEGHKETIARWLEELKVDKEKNEDLELLSSPHFP